MLRSLLAAILAWAVPGLGHMYLGRRAKALYMGGLVLGLFVLGMLLGEGASVSSARFPYHAWGQYLMGLPAILAERVWGMQPLERTVDRLEYGLVFTTVAGIMNLVAVVDAYETARREDLGEGRSGSAA